MKATQRRIDALLRLGAQMQNEGDFLKSAAHYLEAAKLGSDDGAFWLGMLYEWDPPFPDFINDDRLAAQYFTQAADQGHTEAQMHLARMYAEGRGVEKSKEKAEKYGLMAAKSGDPVAQFFYADFLFFDADDVERIANVKEAKRWMKKACAGGDLCAAYALKAIRKWEKTGRLPGGDAETDLEDEADDDWRE